MMFEASQFLSGAGSPIYYFADTGSRMFWLHWLTAAICISVVLKSYSAVDRRHVASHLTDSSYWFNASTLKDYFLMFINAGLRASLWLQLVGSQLVGTLVVARALRDQFGFPEEIIWDPISLTLLYTVIYFVIDELSRFALHVAMDKVPLQIGRASCRERV